MFLALSVKTRRKLKYCVEKEANSEKRIEKRGSDARGCGGDYSLLNGYHNVMATSRRKKWAIGLGIVGLILAAYVLVCPFIRPWLDHRRAERLFAEFRARPSKATVEQLIQILYEGRASQAEATLCWLEF